MNTEKRDVNDVDTRNDLNTGKDTNPDAITGAPGSHPVGTGIGAAAGGAAATWAGAAIGAAVSGPAAPIGAVVGGVVGAIVGAVGGGYAGKGVAENVDPTAEDAYWRANHQSRPYYQKGTSYDEYAPAYKYGWESRGQHAGKQFDEVEPHLAGGWEKAKDKSSLAWTRAKDAARDAWNHVESGASAAAGKVGNTVGSTGDESSRTRLSNPGVDYATPAGAGISNASVGAKSDPDALINDVISHKVEHTDQTL